MRDDSLGTIAYSDNMETLRRTQRQSFEDKKFVYHKGFTLVPEEGRHFSLETHGITPAADIYLNGRQIARREFQSGSYGGHVYDITSITSTFSVDNLNGLLVEVFPTRYQDDLAIGFLDWNPMPIDNGTGIWRDVTVRQTGAVALGPLSVATKFLYSDLGEAEVALRAVAHNLESHKVTVVPSAHLKHEGLSMNISASAIDIPPKGSQELRLTAGWPQPPV